MGHHVPAPPTCTHHPPSRPAPYCLLRAPQEMGLQSHANKRQFGGWHYPTADDKWLHLEGSVSSLVQLHSFLKLAVTPPGRRALAGHETRSACACINIAHHTNNQRYYKQTLIFDSFTRKNMTWFHKWQNHHEKYYYGEQISFVTVHCSFIIWLPWLQTNWRDSGC